ncbi:MAG: adenine phosphoribosyltransferase [Bacillota bacterium]|nr:adenine phosphoribosyltransferase [Bacillota bacterium]
MDLKDKFRHVPNFPKEGIDFIDITTVLSDGESFKYAVDKIAEAVNTGECDVIVGSEARGFILGAPVAYKLGIGFVPVRKKGKLPYQTVSATYELEYGSDTLEMHKDAIKPGQKVVIVDDLLATGGTVDCIINLVRQLGGIVVGAVFLVNLFELPGQARLEKSGVKVTSIVNIEGE